MDRNVKALRKSLKANAKYDDGTVVRFDIAASGNLYTYAAVFASGRWYATGYGKLIKTMYSSDEFAAMLSTADVLSVEVATAWETV